ncbi:MAG: MoaD/ThiS family protein [Oscillospiraceae bacterium]|jgi:molybdopterin converting factor small subunit|nr:MoaD/ThiS family protein [Oscillospiraceae bacterium]
MGRLGDIIVVTLLIPTALRAFTERKAEVRVEGATVGAALEALASEYPDIRQHLYDDDGALRAFINIFVGENNIKNTGGLNTALTPGATVVLVPAIAGGSFAG